MAARKPAKPETLAEARRSDRVSAKTEELRVVVERIVMLQAEQRNLVKVLRRAGASWSMLGAILGTSGEAARQRFGK